MSPSLVLAVLLLACAKDTSGPADAGEGKGPSTSKQVDGGPGTDAAQMGAGSGGASGAVALPPIAPSGCVHPGDLNEFFLPECPEKEDAAVPDIECAPGFDEFGRAVCLDDAGVPKPPSPPACARGGLCQEIVLTGAGQLDVLFLVDDSGSMREEQVALVQEMPALISVLTSGDLDADGVQDFPAAKDLHVGVISSDMGLPGVAGIAGCSGLGDDGVLQHAPAVSVGGCAPSYPAFLAYDASQVDPTQAAQDFACIGTLGTLGCGFEQQLEAVLKAVTPSTSDRRFLNDPPTAPATVGHADDANAGFLRPDSLVALILVTDEEDCSARETRLFTPDQYLAASDPLYGQPLNLRCFYNQASLFPVSRYVDGLLQLRPPSANLVLFAAIAGVPPALVDAAARAGVDFADPVQRDAYYDAMLAAPEMQARIDPATAGAAGNLLPSCDTATGRAYPPRRIVEVARGFGENGIVQSICQPSFAPAMRPIVERISSSLTVGCLPAQQPRDAQGKVACDVIWELPVPGSPQASIELCSERLFLSQPDDPALRVTADGRRRCVVHQVPVDTGTSPPIPQGGESGFYYDDFSSQAVDQCGAGSDQRVVFTSDIVAPLDVRLYVDCAP